MEQNKEQRADFVEEIRESLKQSKESQEKSRELLSEIKEGMKQQQGKLTDAVNAISKYFKDIAHYEDLERDAFDAAVYLFQVFDAIDHQEDGLEVYADTRAVSNLLYNYKQMLGLLRPFAEVAQVGGVH